MAVPIVFWQIWSFLAPAFERHTQRIIAGFTVFATVLLGAGDGTAGRIVQDPQLYENLNAAARDLRGLIGDVRKDPRKYLRVKLSVF